jgi:pyruvate/2-oxoacid:ferredoxin oxidoreductase beta subunit
MVAPDEAIITFYGNGYTPAMKVIEMAARRCAEVTLQHGYRYFVGTSASDMSTNSSFSTPGYASTYGRGSAVGYGNYASGSFSSNTVITPPQTYNIHKPALTVAIKMSNDEKSLEPYGMVIQGVKARPRDAAFLVQSLPKS